jgi:hypothetical protein
VFVGSEAWELPFHDRLRSLAYFGMDTPSSILPSVKRFQRLRVITTRSVPFYIWLSSDKIGFPVQEVLLLSDNAGHAAQTAQNVRL